MVSKNTTTEIRRIRVAVITCVALAVIYLGRGNRPSLLGAAFNFYTAYILLMNNNIKLVPTHSIGGKSRMLFVGEGRGKTLARGRQISEYVSSP